jgi:hypothetical protein
MADIHDILDVLLFDGARIHSGHRDGHLLNRSPRRLLLGGHCDLGKLCRGRARRRLLGQHRPPAKRTKNREFGADEA